MNKTRVKKGLTMGIILLFVGTCLIPAIAQEAQKPLPSSRGNWLYVGGNGPGNYTKIQDAIDNASDGDTVFVYNGTYYETILIDKVIYLIGEDVNTTIIDDVSQSQFTITITQSDVHVKGFMIEAVEGQWYAIYTTKGNNTIECNSIIGGGGIYLKSARNNIRNNYISTHVGGRCGVETTSYNHIIENNSIYSPWGYGISIRGGNTIKNNCIVADIGICVEDNNVINGNLIVAHNPSRIDGSNNVIFDNTFQNSGLLFTNPSDNIVTNNTVNGKSLVYLDKTSNRVIAYDAGQIIISTCDNITITNQNISHSPYAIQVYDSTHCSISNNTISFCPAAGIVVYNSDTIIIADNTINSSTITISKFSLDDEYTSNNIIISRNIIASDTPSGCVIYILNTDNLIFSYNHVVNVGIELYLFCHNCIFCYNNFMDSKFTDIEVPIFSFIRFYHNYWGKTRVLPVLIIGRVINPKTFPGGLYPIWFFIDWRPAQEPYDIPEMR